MDLYAHWLDGEYLKVANRLFGGVARTSPASLAEATLKLHALFGTTVVLSDIQLIDSEAVLRLFGNVHFLRFIRQDSNKGFLRLVAQPESPDNAGRFSIATEGLRRAARPGWLSSTTESPEPIVAMASAILDAGKIDVQQQLADSSRGPGAVLKLWPQCEPLLRGMLIAVNHFSSEGGGPALPTPPGRSLSFYEVLQQEAERQQSAVPVAYREYIERTIEFVDRSIEDPAQRGRRSLVYQRLNTRDWPRDQQIVWHTIVHAWNCAVEETLMKPEAAGRGETSQGASIGSLPLSAPVGLYRNRVTDLLVPLGASSEKLVASSVGRRRVPLSVAWHPAELSWETIAAAVDRTPVEREDFQRALCSDSADRKAAAAEELVRALTPHVAPRVANPVDPWIWCVAGGLVRFAYREAGEAVIFGGAPIAGSVMYLGKLWLRYLVANTLRGAGDRLMAPLDQQWNS